jgi:hypothetical protein
MRDHRVYFYAEESGLVGYVMEFLKEGLQASGTVFIIATEAHRTELETKLMADNLIGPSSAQGGHYVPLDASATLSLFMYQGWPNERMFFQAMDSLLRPHAQGQVVRIYGEMVAVLVANGDDLAAIQLERLWNKFLTQTTEHCSLLCGYDRLEFQMSTRHFTLNQICACHDETVGQPSYAVPHE